MKKLFVLCSLLMAGSALANEPKPFIAVDLVYHIPKWSDWMLDPKRPWVDDSVLRTHVAIGFQWDHQISCPVIATSNDKPYWVNIECWKTWGGYQSGRFGVFAALGLVHQVDQWSSWWLQPERRGWMGDNPRLYGRIGLEWKNRLRCPVFATGTSLFTGAPFHSNSPELYWTNIECGLRFGGK